MPKTVASIASDSDSSEDEDLSRFAACAVSADALHENAMKDKQQRAEEATKRAKSRVRHGHAGDSSSGGGGGGEGEQEPETLDLVSLKIAQALCQRIEAAYQPGKKHERPVESDKADAAPADNDSGIRLFRRVKKGSSLVIPLSEPAFVQEREYGVTAKERCLKGTRYQMPTEEDTMAVISTLGAEGEHMKAEVDASIKERKKKRRIEAEKQRSLAAASKADGTGDDKAPKKKKKKAKIEGVVLENDRPFKDHTQRMKVLVGEQ